MWSKCTWNIFMLLAYHRHSLYIPLFSFPEAPVAYSALFFCSLVFLHSIISRHWEFCMVYSIWDGVWTLVGRTKQTNLWTEECFASTYWWRRAPHSCRCWHEPLFWTFPHENNSCKSRCLLCNVWLVENTSWTFFLLDRRIQTFRTSQGNSYFIFFCNWKSCLIWCIGHVDFVVEAVGSKCARLNFKAWHDFQPRCWEKKAPFIRYYIFI